MDKHNLVIMAGMPRGGSTYLYEELQKHPEIFLPIVKETNFFSYNYHARGKSWFDKLYTEAKDEQKMFDTSPFYFLDTDRFINNVKDFNIEPKVILTLRNPNDWVKSCYYQYKKLNFKTLEYIEFIKKFEVNFESRKYYYDLTNLDYINIVEKFINAFKGNLLLIDFEVFQKDKVTVLNEIEDFIGVKRYFSSENTNFKKVNASFVKHSKIVTYLSKFTILRNIVFSMLPKTALKYIRNKYIYGVPVDDDVTLPDIYETENIFKDKYFKEGSIVRC